MSVPLSRPSFAFYLRKIVCVSSNFPMEVYSARPLCPSNSLRKNIESGHLLSARGSFALQADSLRFDLPDNAM